MTPSSGGVGGASHTMQRLSNAMLWVVLAVLALGLPAGFLAMRYASAAAATHVRHRCVPRW